MISGIPLENWLIFLGLNGLILTGVFSLACSWFNNDSLSIKIVSALLLYLSQITVTVLFFGAIIQTLDPLVIGITNAMISGLLIFRYYPCISDSLQTLPRCIQVLYQSGKIWFLTIVSLLILQMIFTLAKVWVMPPHVLDSLAYRAPPALLWYQTGYIPPILDVPLLEMNGRSLGIAVLMLWYFLFLGDSLLVNLPQWISALILFFTSYSLARSFRASPMWSLNAAAMVYFLPSVIIQCTSTQDHLSINMAFIAAILYCRKAFLRWNPSYLILAGISIGLMFDFKNNAIIYVPALTGYLLFLYVTKKKDTLPSWKKWIKPAITGLCCMILIGGYWTIRNVIVFGDIFGIAFAPQSFHLTQQSAPIYRDTHNPVSEKSDILQPSDKTAFISTKNVGLSFKNLKSNLLEFPERISDSRIGFFPAHLFKVSGFGPQFFTFGIPALIYWLITVFKPSLRVNGGSLVTLSVGLLLIYFFITANDYSYRNFIFFAVLLLVYSACLLSKNEHRVHKGTLHFLAISFLVWSLWTTATPSFANIKNSKEFLGLDRIHQTSGRYINYFKAHPKVYRILSEVPLDEPLAYLTPGIRRSIPYAYADNQWKRKLKYLHIPCSKKGCQPKMAEIEEWLSHNQIRLISTCLQYACALITHPDFFEIGRGLYFYDRAQKKQ